MVNLEEVADHTIRSRKFVPFLIAMVVVVFVAYQFYEQRLAVGRERESADRARATLRTVVLIQKDNRELLQRIVSCTDPKGKCSMRGQAQTVAAIGSINDVTVAAVWCAQRPGTRSLDDLRTCVGNALAAGKR